ncbi:MAG: Ig-like domain-containing protein [Clostridia bacterium]
MKKLFYTFLIVFLLELFNILPSFAAQTPYYDSSYNNNQGAIFANGTAITISEENGSTLVSWDGGSQIVSNSISIFGGGIGNTYTTSQITMNSGTVQNIIGGGIGYTQDAISKVENTNIIINNGTILNHIVGGGYFYSEVDISNIEINGGTIFSVQGAGFATGTINGKTYSVGSKEDSKNSPNKTLTSNVIINSGRISDLLYGGGQGYSFTGTSNLTINSGDMSTAYVTAGGSNGYTENANVLITDGTINIYQTVNRGTLNNATIKVVGGNFNNFYIGGEKDASDVTGSLNTVSANLINGNIKNLDSGTSNQLPIEIDNDNYTVISTPDLKTENDNIGDLKKQISYKFDISPHNLFLFLNENKKLNVSAETFPTGYENTITSSLTFSSKNPEIASVDSLGNITAISAGTTEITATLGSQSISSVVTVNDINNFTTITIILVMIIFIIISLLLLFLLPV